MIEVVQSACAFRGILLKCTASASAVLVGGVRGPTEIVLRSVLARLIGHE
jgi:hypothetical protein